MYAWRDRIGPVELAFTAAGGRSTGSSLSLALDGDDPQASAANLAAVAADFAPAARVADMRQVHGSAVALADPGQRPACDGLVADEPDLLLVVRVADCVPVLLADVAAGVVAAVHAGRLGMVAGVVPEALERMRERGAREPRAWIGPHVCGGCYEVPAALRAEVDAVVPGTATTTTWGTPALDIGAGVRRQLVAAGVPAAGIVEVEGCTVERDDLFSYRRDGARAGRFAGLVVRHGEAS